MLAVLSGYRLAAMKTNRAYRKINQSGLCFVILLGSLNAPINGNPVGGRGVRARGGDLMPGAIPAVGLLIVRSDPGVGTFD